MQTFDHLGDSLAYTHFSHSEKTGMMKDVRKLKTLFQVSSNVRKLIMPQYRNSAIMELLLNLKTD